MLSPHTPGHEQRLKLRSGSFFLSQQPSKKANDYANALYKTELCRSFNDAGYCRYGLKCRFAHGTDDLRPVSRHKKYKTEPCKNYSRDGVCPYGNRCRFVHEDDPPEMLARARSASFSSLESPSPSPSSSLMDLARLGDYDGKQAYDSFPSRSNRARSVSFHSLYSTSVSTSQPSLSEKDSEKDGEKIKMDKDYDLSFGARMGAQPPAHSVLGKSAEPSVSDVAPSFRYYDDHSLSMASSLHSASPSRSTSQSSLKNMQTQIQVASPSASPASLAPVSAAPMYSSPPRQVFTPTPFKSVVGFTPAQSVSPPLPPAATVQQGAWRVEEIEKQVIEKASATSSSSTSERSSVSELTSSISSLSLSLARSPATIPKSSASGTGMFSTSAPSAWPSVITSHPVSDSQPQSLPSASPLQSRSPPSSHSSLNGVSQPKSPEKFPSSIIISPPAGSSTAIKPVESTSTLVPALPSPPQTPGNPSPTGSDLTLDLFAAASKRLPIFATLTLSPKKHEPIRA